MPVKNKTIIVAIFILLLGMSGYAVFFTSTEKQPIAETTNTAAEATATDAATNAAASNTPTNASTATAAGYVALEDITMDTSKWVTYRNEELGVELRVPGELYVGEVYGSNVKVLTNFALLQSEDTLLTYVKNEESEKRQYITFRVDVSADPVAFDAFSAQDQVNGIAHRSTQGAVRHEFYVAGYIFSLFVSLGNLADQQPMIDLIDEIAQTVTLPDAGIASSVIEEFHQKKLAVAKERYETFEYMSAPLKFVRVTY